MKDVERVEVVAGQPGTVNAVVWRAPKVRRWRVVATFLALSGLTVETWRIVHPVAAGALFAWWAVVAVAMWAAWSEDRAARRRPANLQEWVYDLIFPDGHVRRVGRTSRPALRVCGYVRDGWVDVIMRPVRCFWVREDSDRWETQRILTLHAITGGDHFNTQKARHRSKRSRLAHLLVWGAVIRMFGWLVPEMSLRRRDRKAVRAAVDACSTGAVELRCNGTGVA